MPVPIFATPGVGIPSIISKGLVDFLYNYTNKQPPDNFNIPIQNYFPNYEGDVMSDLLNNPLIDWQKFLSKAPVFRNEFMNQGVNPNLIPGRSQLSYSIPAPSYLGNAGMPGRTSLPTNFTPFTPAFNTVFSNNDPFLFRPGPGFQMNPGTNGGQAFGTTPLFNASNPEPQVNLQDLIKTLSPGFK